MDQKLRSTFELLEAQRVELMSGIRGLPEDRLTQHPPGKWHVMKILAHLVAGERSGLLYVRKKILGAATTRDSGWWESAKMLMLIISQRLPGLKYKAPGIIEEKTKSYSSLAELEADWSAVRNEWFAFLEALPDTYANRKIFKHAFAGKLNLRQGLLFFREHIIHHRPQIDRLLSGGRR